MINQKKSYITYNKKIKFLYFIKKEFEVGLSLFGWEVKSIRLGKINIINSYIKFKKLNIYLINAIISPLNNLNKYEIIKSRKIKLLIKKKEIFFLFNKIKIEGYTIKPSCVYWKKNWIKLNICLVKGKKKYDKRKNIKEKEWKKKKSFLKKTLKIK
ncbi:MAG: SsrA-binding protein SmpB [Enterobacteriaceae bacterium PSpyr]|nr:MAG: SsrA-binding protein SmpB [Enterobacteriaceae bacterium PSpyr]